MEIHILNYVIAWNFVFGLEANTGKLVENSAEENALVNVLWEILCRLGWENTNLSPSNQNLKITAGLILESCGQADNRECADDPTGGKVVETGERLWGVWWEGIEGEQLHFWQYSLLAIRSDHIVYYKYLHELVCGRELFSVSSKSAFTLILRKTHQSYNDTLYSFWSWSNKVWDWIQKMHIVNMSTYEVCNLKFNLKLNWIWNLICMYLHIVKTSTLKVCVN